MLLNTILLNIFWILACSWPITGFAATALDINNQTIRAPLISYAQHWVDSSANLTYREVQQHLNEFKDTPENDVLNIGYSRAAHWLRFSLSNTSNQSIQRVISIPYPLLDEITLYQEQNGNLVIRKQGRIHRAINAADNRAFSFTLNIPAHQTQQYTMRVISQDAISIPLWLMTEAEYFRSSSLFDQAMSYYFGLTSTIAIFTGFLWFFLREKLYQYYTLGIIFHHGFFFIFLNGYAPQIFGLSDVWWSREVFSVVLNVALICLIQFARELFNLKLHHPRCYQFLHFNLFLSCLGVVLAFSVEHFYAITIGSVGAAFTAATLFFIGILNLRTKFLVATFYLSAWSLVIIGGIIYSLKTWALVPSNLFTEFSWQTGAAVEAILLTLALTIRIKDEAEQREVAQQETLTLQRQTNELLEQRVKERTLELEGLTEKLATIGDTDQLTQLKNRRFFDRVLPEEVKRMTEQQLSMAILVLDIDHFKAFNDNYGHLAGDECIKTVAKTISDELHWPRDCAIRYGGEEFCVFLPNTDSNGAFSVANRIRENVEQTQFKFDDRLTRVTISVGIAASTPTQNDTIASFMEKADEALYAVKRSGRNRVLIYNPNVSEFFDRATRKS